MRDPVKRYEHVTETASNTRGMSNLEATRFHYHNPRGLVAKKRRLDETISRMVKEGKCNGGAILAYGTFNDGHEKLFRELVNKRRVSWIKLSVAVSSAERAIDSAERFIAKIYNEGLGV